MLDRPALNPAAEDVRRLGNERFLPGTLVGLFSKCALRPIDPSVEPQIGSVQVIGTVGQGFRIEPLHTLVRHSVAIGVGQLPDAGRCRHIDRAIVPEYALREHHLVGEHGPPVVPPIAIDVLQAKNAVRALSELLLNRVIRSRRLGHVQAALVVHVHDHRALDQRWPGRQLNFKALGNCDLVDGIRAGLAAANQHCEDQNRENGAGLHGMASAN